MPQDINKKNPPVSPEQKLVLNNRKSLTLTGVENVDSFSDTEIVLLTNLDKLTIKGQRLNISRLDVDLGEFSMDGYVNSIVYSKASPRGNKGFFERIFK